MSLKNHKKILISLGGALLFFFIWHEFKGGRQRGPAPASITIANVITQAMPFELSFPAQIEAVQSVQIRPQVSGLLKKIDFTPGNLVKAGQLLFEIVPDSYQLALDQAQAALARDQAQLENYRANESRSRELIKGNYISQQDYTTIKAQYQMQQAVVQIDQTQIDNAKLQLSYTQITSPITGKTGNVTVKVGDLISASNTTAGPLVTINEIDPVYATFNLPQNSLRTVLTYKKQNSLTVEVWSEDGSKSLGKGVLAFVDNTVNTATGTVLLKGLIPNKTRCVWPAQLVMVKLILYVNPQALVVPSSTIKADDQGQFVYKVVDGKSIIQRITVGWQAGESTVVSAGLKAGETVIKQVPPNLQNGNPVIVYEHKHQ